MDDKLETAAADDTINLEESVKSTQKVIIHENSKSFDDDTSALMELAELACISSNQSIENLSSHISHSTDRELGGPIKLYSNMENIQKIAEAEANISMPSHSNVENIQKSPEKEVDISVSMHYEKDCTIQNISNIREDSSYGGSDRAAHQEFYTSTSPINLKVSKKSNEFEHKTVDNLYTEKIGKISADGEKHFKTISDDKLVEKKSSVEKETVYPVDTLDTSSYLNQKIVNKTSDKQTVDKASINLESKPISSEIQTQKKTLFETKTFENTDNLETKQLKSLYSGTDGIYKTSNLETETFDKASNFDAETIDKALNLEKEIFNKNASLEIEIDSSANLEMKTLEKLPNLEIKKVDTPNMKTVMLDKITNLEKSNLKTETFDKTLTLPKEKCDSLNSQLSKVKDLPLNLEAKTTDKTSSLEIHNKKSFDSKTETVKDLTLYLETKTIDKTSNLEKKAIDATSNLSKERLDEISSFETKILDKGETLNSVTLKSGTLDKSSNLENVTTNKSSNVETEQINKTTNSELEKFVETSNLEAKKLAETSSIGKEMFAKMPYLETNTLDKTSCLEIESFDKISNAKIETPSKKLKLQRKNVYEIMEKNIECLESVTKVNETEGDLLKVAANSEKEIEFEKSSELELVDTKANDNKDTNNTNEESRKENELENLKAFVKDGEVDKNKESKIADEKEVILDKETEKSNLNQNNDIRNKGELDIESNERKGKENEMSKQNKENEKESELDTKLEEIGQKNDLNNKNKERENVMELMEYENDKIEKEIKLDYDSKASKKENDGNDKNTASREENELDDKNKESEKEGKMDRQNEESENKLCNKNKELGSEMNNELEESEKKHEVDNENEEKESKWDKNKEIEKECDIDSKNKENEKNIELKRKSKECEIDKKNEENELNIKIKESGKESKIDNEIEESEKKIQLDNINMGKEGEMPKKNEESKRKNEIDKIKVIRVEYELNNKNKEKENKVEIESYNKNKDIVKESILHKKTEDVEKEKEMNNKNKQIEMDKQNEEIRIQSELNKNKESQVVRKLKDKDKEDKLDTKNKVNESELIDDKNEEAVSELNLENDEVIDRDYVMTSPNNTTPLCIIGNVCSLNDKELSDSHTEVNPLSHSYECDDPSENMKKVEESHDFSSKKYTMKMFESSYIGNRSEKITEKFEKSKSNDIDETNLKVRVDLSNYTVLEPADNIEENTENLTLLKETNSSTSTEKPTLLKETDSSSSTEKPTLLKEANSSTSTEKPALLKETNSSISTEMPTLLKKTDSSISTENPTLLKEANSSTSTEKPTLLKEKETNSSISTQMPTLLKDTDSSISTEKPTLLNEVNSTTSTEKPTLLKETNSSISTETPTLLKEVNSSISTEKQTLLKEANSIISTEKLTLVKETNSSISTEMLTLLKEANSISKEKPILLKEANSGIYTEMSTLLKKVNSNISTEKPTLLREANSIISTEKLTLVKEANSSISAEQPTLLKKANSSISVRTDLIYGAPESDKQMVTEVKSLFVESTKSDNKLTGKSSGFKRSRSDSFGTDNIQDAKRLRKSTDDSDDEGILVIDETVHTARKRTAKHRSNPVIKTSVTKAVDAPSIIRKSETSYVEPKIASPVVSSVKSNVSEVESRMSNIQKKITSVQSEISTIKSPKESSAVLPKMSPKKLSPIAKPKISSKKPIAKQKTPELPKTLVAKPKAQSPRKLPFKSQLAKIVRGEINISTSDAIVDLIESSKSASITSFIDLNSKENICTRCSKIWNDQCLKLLFEGNESYTVNSRITYGAVVCMNIYVSVNYPEMKEEALIGLLDRADLAENLKGIKVASLNYILVTLINAQIIRCCDPFKPVYKSSKKDKAEKVADKTLASLENESELNPKILESHFGSTKKSVEHHISELSSLPNEKLLLKKTTDPKLLAIINMIRQERRSLSDNIKPLYDKLICNLNVSQEEINAKKFKYLYTSEAFAIHDLYSSHKLYFNLFVEILRNRGYALLVPDFEKIYRYIVFSKEVLKGKETPKNSVWDPKMVCCTPMPKRNDKQEVYPKVREILAIFCDSKHRHLKGGIGQLKTKVVSLFKKFNDIKDTVGICFRLYCRYVELMFEKEETEKTEVFLDLLYLPKDIRSNIKDKLVIDSDISFLPPSCKNIANIISYLEDSSKKKVNLKRSLPESFIDKKVELTKHVKTELLQCIKTPQVADLLEGYAKLRNQMDCLKSVNDRKVGNANGKNDSDILNSNNTQIKLMIAKLLSDNIPMENVPAIVRCIFEKVAKKKIC